MTSADIIALCEREFGSKIKAKNLTVADPFVVIDPGDLLAFCRFLKTNQQLQFDLLNCISGVDYLEPDAKKAPKAGFEPHTEVVYHVSSFQQKHRFVFKLILPRWKNNQPGQLPEVPSVTGVWRAADWHEREVYDLSGVWFTGHPNMTRILLADDWVGYPLRKDYEYPLEYHGIRGR